MHPAKRQKLIKSTTLAISGDNLKTKPIVEQTADIFRLNDDCFDAIFKWLFAEDFPALSKTCVRIQDLVKTYFARIYPQKRIEIHRLTYRVAIKKYDGLQHFIRNITFLGTNDKRRRNWYSQSINVHGDYDLVKYYSYLGCHRTPKSIRFVNMALLRGEWKSLGDKLKYAESIEFIRCELDQSYDDILVNCENVTALKVWPCTFTLDDKLWLQRHYPKLESLDIHFGTVWDHSELFQFFVLNPQIKRFSCRSRLSAQLSKIQNVIEAVAGNITQLQELFLTIGGGCEFKSIYTQLLDVSQRQEFSRLSLEFVSADTKDMFIDNLNNLACIDKLHALHLTNIDIDKDLPNNIDVLANLKELHLNHMPNSEYFAQTITAVTPNLELLVVRNTCYFTPSVVGFIRPFIEQLPKFRKIVLVQDVWITINQRLAELNKLRQKLIGACTVFIWLTAPQNGFKEKPAIVGNTLVRMVPISDEYDHF